VDRLVETDRQTDIQPDRQTESAGLGVCVCERERDRDRYRDRDRFRDRDRDRDRESVWGGLGECAETRTEP
jgi:hypothetical protein